MNKTNTTDLISARWHKPDHTTTESSQRLFDGKRSRLINNIKAFTKQLEDDDDVFEEFPELQHNAVQALIDLYDAMNDAQPR